ncbi:MAG: winged helix-turn-helix transcriptional regulator [Phycisphaeraceae bacterium]|nr:winged helix-turn-helix transcriptional regulator [Phycisphaeraceae bacterium]
MVKSNALPLDRVLAALADPSRRAMVERLREGECTVGELAAMFDFSLPAVSKHLRVLKRADLLRQARRGRARVCRLNREPLLDVSLWLTTRQNLVQKLDIGTIPTPPPVQAGVQLPEFD